MAYLILSTDGNEWDRRELSGAVVVGRAPDCEISVHDILLSRRHCRITPISTGWLLIDLASRNGTIVGDKPVEERALKNGDVIRVGKTTITFRAESFVKGPKRSDRPQIPPRITLEEASAGTVFGMEYVEPAESIRRPFAANRPTPKPRPMDPPSFESDDLYSMLEQIASSSWDSIYSVNSQPLRRDRPIPRPILRLKDGTMPKIQLPPSRPQRPLVSLSLQAMPALPTAAIAPMPVLPLPRPMIRKKPLRLSRWGRWVSRLGNLRML